ncbi:enoyl-CoA hydratase [Pararhodospirillum photometricum]|nr:enoyl-CoA hydratase [Pararhodospirillum photometricum]
MTPGDPILLSRLQDGLLTLTLNRPDARNALSRALMSALEDALEQAAASSEVRVVVLAANGPAFCAGHDLREMRADPSLASCEALFTQCSRLMTRLVRLPQPVIARVQGMATAAGCQLVASCDLALAGDSARFATPGVAIGLFCSTPMVALSRAVGRKKALEMLFTGHPVSAAEALTHGLVNAVVPDATLEAETQALAREIAAKSPLTLRLGKAAFYRQLEMPLDDAYAYASAIMTRNMMAEDAREGIDAFLEKRPAVWRGV